MASRPTSPAAPFRSIAMLGRPEERYFNVLMARMLAERHGAAVHLYAGTEQQAAFFRREGEGVFASVNVVVGALALCHVQGLDEASVMARARDQERRLGVTINQLAMANRHLGRGFALGGFHHPRSRYSELTSYAQMVNAFSQELAYWEDQVRAHGLTLFLGTDRSSAVVAEALGIPYRVLATSRFRNFHNWAHNAFFQNPEFDEAYRETTDELGEEIEAPYHYHAVYRDRFLREVRLPTVVRNLGMRVARHAYWRLRGYQKAKGYYLGDELGYYVRQWRDWRKLKRLATATLKSLEGQRFVFYPLHTEPETALQGLSPEFFYQLSLIAAVCRDLPAGVKLAVKEIFAAVGRRPDNFYDQIAAFKNVVLLPPDELGVACARQADATVTINGTAGLEAAVAGRPVIAFGRRNIYNCLPHVRVVEDESRLRGYLADALDGRFDREQARHDAQRFLAAVVARSFDMGSYDFIRLDAVDPQVVSDACNALERSLGAPSWGTHAMPAQAAG